MWLLVYNKVVSVPRQFFLSDMSVICVIGYEVISVISYILYEVISVISVICYEVIRVISII